MSAVLLFLLGCDSSTSAGRCDSATVTVSNAPAATVWIDDELTLEGTAVSRSAIAWVRVLGVDATADTANFGQWSVKLPIDVLRGAGQDVTLEAEASVACNGETYTSNPFTLRVLPATGIPVTTLDLDVEDAEYCHVPLDGSVPLTVTVTADVESVGGTVELTASAGELAGVEADSVALVEEDGQAVARAYYTPGSDAGDVRILAAATGSSARQEELRVVGPPVFSGSLTLAAGHSGSVLLSTGGTLASCHAFGDTAALDALTIDGVAVGSGLDFAPTAPADCASYAADDVRLVEVTAASGAAGTTAALSCADVYGQSATLSITVQ